MSYPRSNRVWTRGRGRGGTPNRCVQAVHPAAAKLPTPICAVPQQDFLAGLAVDSVVALDVPVDVQSVSSADVEIQNLQCIGSYDWLHSGSNTPTIIVPSSPPEWKGDPKFPFHLSPDEEGHSYSQLRLPSSSLLPVIKAADAMQKHVDWPSVDVIVGRNSLTRLMGWASGSSKRSDGAWHDFRIDIELAGDKTVLLNRWEAEYWDAPNAKRYGRNFEHAMSTPAKGCEARTSGHHRVVKYDFLGLAFVVRSHVDACLPTLDEEEHADTVPSVGAPAASGLADESDSAAPSPPPTLPQEQPPPDALHVIHAGREIPQAATIDVATRSLYWLRNMRWADILPGLYLTQTQHFYIGMHRQELFFQLIKHSLADEELAEHKRAAETGFRKLGEALRAIQGIAVARGREKRLSLVCVEGQMNVYERVGAESCLTDDVRRRFEDKATL
ncbi:hypothetical protein FA95DRAFT_1608633 [Auriscalpium vulgare]|uniref:Uncharacterized protein n=1 Tax=Auriscalpium vulgare TaxID=40419 RepID=A0ACB8RL84_9AGAM|nr:hypothetical protein FA95DRAFT_1608633 [Auriscalpium vulgare]